jgi:hypothetical protein
MPEIERGLCVVCQDEEATLAVVDCGHLCMCAREYCHQSLFLSGRARGASSESIESARM